MAPRRIIDEGPIRDNHLRYGVPLSPIGAGSLVHAMPLVPEFHMTYGEDVHEITTADYAQQLAAHFEAVNLESNSSSRLQRSKLMEAHLEGIEFGSLISGHDLSPATSYLLQLQLTSEVRTAKQVAFLRNICQNNTDAALHLVTQNWREEWKVATEDAFQEVPFIAGSLALRGLLGESAEQISAFETTEAAYAPAEIKALQWGVLAEVSQVTGIPATTIQTNALRHFPRERNALTNRLCLHLSDLDTAMAGLLARASSPRQFRGLVAGIASKDHNAAQTVQCISQISRHLTVSSPTRRAMR